jgi:ATP-dependent protease ClpP protease subunit
MPRKKKSQQEVIQETQTIEVIEDVGIVDAVLSEELVSEEVPSAEEAPSVEESSTNESPVQSEEQIGVEEPQEERIDLDLLQFLTGVQLEKGISLRERTILLTGVIDDTKFEAISNSMSVLESQGDDPITIKLHSPGGSTYETLAILGRMRNSPCQIIVEGYGQIMSAAVLILAAGHVRRMSQFAWLMHHEASYSLEDTHSKIKQQVKQVDAEEERWASWMSKFTKKDKDFWLSTGVGSDAYFNPEQCLELGVIDEIF